MIPEITLTPKLIPKVPVEAESISPDVFAGRTIDDIKSLEAWVGNKKVKIGELFQISGTSEVASNEPHILIDGDVPGIKWIGTNMTKGKITINGDVGMHLGSMMRGGEIVVKGSVSDWAGAEMKGGLLRIMGDAGNFLGAAYRGSRLGMEGGVIIVNGNIGDRAGELMRRGVIVALGDAGEFTGTRMIAGTIMVFGRMGARSGAQMKRGTIVVYGGVERMLPTFRYDAACSPVFLRVYLKTLYTEFGVQRAKEYIDSVYDRYHGDLAAEIGKGEILILREK